MSATLQNLGAHAAASAQPGSAVPHAHPPAGAGQWFDLMARPATVMQFPRDAEIIAQGDLAAYCFQVATGCVRAVRMLDDGRRLIGEFLLPGDIFGLASAGDRGFGAEAVTAVTLRRFPLPTIAAWAARDAGFAQAGWQHLTRELRRARERQVLLGRRTATERIASFLLEMSDRMHGRPGVALDLPMSRSDMADYLGLTVETVCRGLTQMHRQGVIRLDRTRITLCDRRALSRIVGDPLS